MEDKENKYSKAPFVLFLIAAILAILRGLISVTILVILNYTNYLSELSRILSFIGDNVFYIGLIFSIMGLFLGITLLIVSFKIKKKYDTKIFFYIALILSGFILTEFSTESILVLIGLLIGIIKYEDRKYSINLLFKIAIILGLFSLAYSFIKYFINKELIGMLGYFGGLITYLSIISIILGVIVFLVSIITYSKTKNNPSKNNYVFLIILGAIGFFSSVSYEGVILIVIGLLGLRSVKKTEKNKS